jgi:hypothetical protein
MQLSQSDTVRVTGGGQTLRLILIFRGGERITRIDVFPGIFDTTYEVVGVRFATNYKQSDIFGHNAGECLSLEAPPNGEIYAFFGRQGLFVDALGVYVRST